MKKILSILLLGLLWMQGCEKEPSEKTPYGPGPRSFAPRDANYMWMVVGSSLSIRIATYNQFLDEKSWPDCYLTTWMYVDAPIEAVEKRSRGYHDRIEAISIISIEEQVTYLKEYPGKHPDVIFDGPLYPKLIEYCTEGVADLKITADRSLFGKSPGATLNDHFAIWWVMQDVDYIRDFRYDDFSEIYFPLEERLDRWGSLIKLDTWLARKPTIPEIFEISTIEPISPEDKESVTITVELTTSKGKRFITSQRPYKFPDTDQGVLLYREEFLATRLDE